MGCTRSGVVPGVHGGVDDWLYDGGRVLLAGELCPPSTVSGSLQAGQRPPVLSKSVAFTNSSQPVQMPVCAMTRGGVAGGRLLLLGELTRFASSRLPKRHRARRPESSPEAFVSGLLSFC